MQHVRRHPRLQQYLDGTSGNERCLFGGLCDHRIAGRQRGSNLAGENSQREIPRADTTKHTASAEFQFVALARRAWHALARTELLARTISVVTQKIDRLAHLRNAVWNRAAAFSHTEGH